MAEDAAGVAGELERLERLLLEPEVCDSALAADPLCNDFQELGMSGRVYDKAEVVAALGDGPRVPLAASDFAVALLAPPLALVTCRALRPSEPPVESLRSSLWRRCEDGRWRLRFHPGTVVPA